MSSEPLVNRSNTTAPNATSQTKANNKLSSKKRLFQSVKNTIKNSNNYTSLTKVSLSAERELFLMRSENKVSNRTTVEDSKMTTKFFSDNSQPLLLDEINEFSKRFSKVLHTLMYGKYIRLMFFLHNEMNKRACKAQLRMTMDAEYNKEDELFDESSVEIN